MSNPITELSGKHIGERITVEDESRGTSATGILFSVNHSANMIAMWAMNNTHTYDVGRRESSISLGGNADITLGPDATFTVHDGKS